MVYPFHFNFFKLASGLPLMAGGGSNKRSLIKERVMLIGFLLCVGVIPCCLCLDSGGGSKVGGSCIESERRALLAIKAAIYDPGEWLSSWTGQDCCRWRGVGCDNTSGHVVKLNLRYPYDFYEVQVYGVGKFPQPSKVHPSISSLIYLRYLDLSMNNFSGAPIPEFIGSLVHLEYLDLSKAWFSGPIPGQIGNLSSLRYLDLRGGYPFLDKWSGLTEYYPIALRVNGLQWLSGIPSLQYLDLSFANLSMASNWLHEINMHPSLLALKLLDTGLPGIPSTLQHVNFTSLTIFDLSDNDFQSAFPRWLLNISSLVHLDLSNCRFHGRLPIILDMLGNHSQLTHLALGGNQISGEMPETIGNFAHLQVLGLSDNNIAGQIPKNISMLCNLQDLDLSINSIGGEIISLIEGFSKCINNKLDGRSFLQSLEFLDLSYNAFGGAVPESLGQLSALMILDLSSNTFTGYLTEVHFSNLTGLDYLDLSYNSLKSEPK
uniref:Receptor-like protein EIX1 n=1 Tax=Elaeis guineensis var. tenera TaxID=51953 RepID=A0A6I9QP20_ELAGV|nr:receptor-like protein EIX1 [Elaeis guineensis]